VLALVLSSIARASSTKKRSRMGANAAGTRPSRYSTPTVRGIVGVRALDDVRVTFDATSRPIGDPCRARHPRSAPVPPPPLAQTLGATSAAPGPTSADRRGRG